MIAFLRGITVKAQHFPTLRNGGAPAFVSAVTATQVCWNTQVYCYFLIANHTYMFFFLHVTSFSSLRIVRRKLREFLPSCNWPYGQYSGIFVDKQSGQWSVGFVFWGGIAGSLFPQGNSLCAHTVLVLWLLASGMISPGHGMRSAAVPQCQSDACLPWVPDTAILLKDCWGTTWF